MHGCPRPARYLSRAARRGIHPDCGWNDQRCRTGASPAVRRVVELECAALVRGDVIGLVALDLVLWLLLRGVMHVPLIEEVLRMDGDDRARHAASLGVPGDVIADSESPAHGAPRSSSSTRHPGPVSGNRRETQD